VFDVNETLLDLAALDPHFERAFGDPGAREGWFQQLIQSALVTIATGRYHQFGTIAKAALDTTATRHGVTLGEADKQAILQAMQELPPHPEVPAALGRLRDRGLRLAALTNSTGQVAQAQLANAGLAELFEQILSADQAGRLKPAPEPYRMAADALGVPVEQLWLVAAHGWDVAGRVPGRLRRPPWAAARPDRARPRGDRRGPGAGGRPAPHPPASGRRRGRTLIRPQGATRWRRSGSTAGLTAIPGRNEAEDHLVSAASVPRGRVWHGRPITAALWFLLLSGNLKAPWAASRCRAAR
jgi:2-haloacid dehalogenase